jgi:hypothetical protein
MTINQNTRLKSKIVAGLLVNKKWKSWVCEDKKKTQIVINQNTRLKNKIALKKKIAAGLLVNKNESFGYVKIKSRPKASHPKMKGSGM